MLSSTSAVTPNHAASAAAFSSSAALGPEERLLCLIVSNQLKQMDSAETSINLNYDELARLKQEAAEAIQHAKEAQESSGFWGAIASFLGSDIGELCSVVAAAAAVVATGGAATAIVAAVATAASVAAKHAKDLGIPMEVAMVIAVVAALASLLCGNAGSLIEVSDKLRSVAGQLHVGATVAGGAATAGSAAAGGIQAKYEANVAHARADGRSAQGRSELTNADIEEAIDHLARLMEQSRSATTGVSGMLERENQATSAVIFGLGSAA